MDPITAYFAGVLSTLVALVVLWLALRVLRPFVAARFSDVDLGFLHFVGMRLRRTDPNVLVGALIILAKRGEPADPLQLEATYMTLREDDRTIDGLIRAYRPDLATLDSTTAPSA